ncbi:hypothetical protein [Brunnivagina elsteri]|uniref:Uncharacterized protein n=1 Tax=Brunnivagina elsteri CCALA 953 TaxID=987040 RepID=A0A2A2TM63_9CYAN|nr:hypothetical protein [Calothrix elsteri]PAX58088.1 hypothetical protein CK510_08270 [Calothrix elsteri CCALA 953]
MSLFNYPIHLTANTNITDSTNQTNRLSIEVSPATQISETIVSLSIFDYLGGLGIMLIFVAIIRIIYELKQQSSNQKPKSQRELSIELLERIWMMNTSKTKD